MCIQQAIDILEHYYNHMDDKKSSAWYSETQLQWALETAITVMNERVVNVADLSDDGK